MLKPLAILIFLSLQSYMAYAIWDIQYAVQRALPVRLVTTDGLVIAQFLDHYSCEKWRRTSGPPKSFIRFHCLGGL